jgi:hypothetical protein
MTPHLVEVYAPAVAAFFPLGPPQGYFFDRGRKFRLMADFRYVDDEAKGIDVTVPKGTVTDFNSVPRLLWWWFAPQDCVEAGVVHDYLYENPGEGRSDGERWTRGELDDLWRRILHLDGMRRSKRLAGWLGVRIGGWNAWRQHRRRDAEDAP